MANQSIIDNPKLSLPKFVDLAADQRLGGSCTPRQKMCDVLVPIAFTTDHIATLYEFDLEYDSTRMSSRRHADCGHTSYFIYHWGTDEEDVRGRLEESDRTRTRSRA